MYDGFAVKGHAGGRDASSGYGGPAVAALLAMAAFADARRGSIETVTGLPSFAELCSVRVVIAVMHTVDLSIHLGAWSTTAAGKASWRSLSSRLNPSCAGAASTRVQ